MQEFPFTIEVWQNGWRYENECANVVDASDECDSMNETTGKAYRVVESATGKELYFVCAADDPEMHVR